LHKKKVLGKFGHDTNIATIEAFMPVDEENYREVEEWEEMLGVQDEPLERSGEALTKKCNGVIHVGDGWIPRSSTPSSIYSVNVVFDGEL
jgi:hypothetical protein